MIIIKDGQGWYHALDFFYFETVWKKYYYFYLFFLLLIIKINPCIIHSTDWKNGIALQLDSKIHSYTQNSIVWYWFEFFFEAWRSLCQESVRVLCTVSVVWYTTYCITISFLVEINLESPGTIPGFGSEGHSAISYHNPPELYKISQP